MPEQPAPFSLESIHLAQSVASIPPAALARWASMAASLAVTGVLPSQPAA